MNIFKNREEAGRQLGEKFLQYKNKEVVVFALPRGGVIVGKEVARLLNAPLDILTARKVAHPDFPEYAVAAVGQSGYVVKNEEAVRSIPEGLFDELVESEEAEARRRHDLYLKGIPMPNVKGKIAIVVDDGLATGLTAKAAIKDLRERSPAKIIFAVPVAPDTAFDFMSGVADEFVCLYPDPAFMAISAYYDEFPQINNGKVIRALKEVNKRIRRII